jgi:hypothetical protein
MTNHAQHSLHPTWGRRRVFVAGFWLGVGSGKMALSHPTPSAYPQGATQTHTVRRTLSPPSGGDKSPPVNGCDWEVSVVV